MAAALIDEGTVHRMIAEAVAGIVAASSSRIAVAQLGQADPENSSAWVRVETISIERKGRQRSDNEPEDADITVQLSGWVTEGQTSIHAIGEVKSYIAQALRDVTDIDPNSGTIVHQIDWRQVQSQVDVYPDENRRIICAMVVAAGTVTRHAGATIAAFVT